MIVRMAKARVLGPRARLDETLRALQDFGLVHLADAGATEGLEPLALAPREARRRRQFERAIADCDAALTLLHDVRAPAAPPPAAPAAPAIRQLARWARLARCTRRAAERLTNERAALDEERALILKYRDFLAAFEPLLRRVARSDRLTAIAVVAPAGARGLVDRLERAMREAAGDEWLLRTRPLATGDLAVLLVLPRASAERIEHLLAEASVPEIPVPAAYAGLPLAEAVPRMLARLDEIPAERAEVERRLAELARTASPELRRARAAMHDLLAAIEARALCGVTPRAFAIEGWLPVDAFPRLVSETALRFGGDVTAEEVSREDWAADGAPVELRNPRLLRPFETLVRVMPLPRYGTLDPTPFVAVFFPLFFGMMLGDVGYGLALALLAVALRRKSRPGTTLRAVSEIAVPCAAFSIIFGFLYGELLGDVGRHFLGMRALLFDREEAVVAALAVAVGIGVVHIVLGLVLGAVTVMRGHPRQALGRSVAALMVVVVVVALLAAFEVLPSRFFTPAVVVVLVAFPIVVLAEGLLGAIELMSTFGNILSYARIMALGTASVMLAVVANRMVGAIGSTVVGLLFALLFHLVNFAIGLFSPTIHALRLHYVEFFGKFYSPGGRPYHPFARWSASAGR